MAKSGKKKAKGAISAKKGKRTTKSQTKAAEYVSCLLELHKLQGVLLKELGKQV